MSTVSECVKKHRRGRYDQKGLYVQSGKRSAPIDPGMMRMRDTSAKKACTFPFVKAAIRLAKIPRLHKCRGRNPIMSPPSLTSRISWTVSPASSSNESMRTAAVEFFPEIFRIIRSTAVIAAVIIISMPMCSGQKCENESIVAKSFAIGWYHCSTLLLCIYTD